MAPLLSKCLNRTKELCNMVVMVTLLWRAPTWWDTMQGMGREGLIKRDSTKDMVE